MISRVSLLAVGVLVLGGATSGSCSGPEPATSTPPAEVHYTALEVNQKIVGLPLAVLTKVDARELAPGVAPPTGGEQPIAVAEASIQFSNGLAPGFHGWLSSALSNGTPTNLALVFLSWDYVEVGRITMPRAQLTSLRALSPGDGGSPLFIATAQDYNSSRSNKSGSQPLMGPPDDGDNPLYEAGTVQGENPLYE